MARIRSMKPEFWDSEDTATLSPLAALTYAGLWNLADDEGRGRFGTVLIHGKLHAVRPGVTTAKTKAALDELQKRELIAIYKDETKTAFFYIPTFKRHQKPQKPLPSKLPSPPVELLEKYGSTTVVHPPKTRHGGEREGRGEVDGEEGEEESHSPARGTPPDPLQGIVSAYRQADQTVPEEKCLVHVRSAIARGASPEALFRKVVELRGQMKIWTICDLLTDKAKNGPEFKPAKTTCGNCGGTGTVANGVKDGAVTLGPCPRCTSKATG